MSAGLLDLSPTRARLRLTVLVPRCGLSPDAEESTMTTSPDPARSRRDQMALRRLVDDYAGYADRRQPARQAALFTPDARLAVHDGDPSENEPTQVLRGREELEVALGGLQAYEHTTHFIGQSTLTVNGDGNGATGTTYCLAHHVWTEEGQRMLLVMSIRYLDDFARHDDEWLISQRILVIDWLDRRPLTA